MKRSTAGYTLVEVMTALVVMTVGAAGILAMQGASVHANQDAYETTVAVNFATTWVERLKRDARRWTATGNSTLESNTVYLSALAEPRAWVVPTTAISDPPASLESAAADYHGFDTKTVSEMRYCINLRLTVVHAFNPLTGGTTITSDANAVRADVRVWWPRSGQAANRRRIESCLTTVLTDAELADFGLRKHHLSTLLSWREPGLP